MHMLSKRRRIENRTNYSKRKKLLQTRQPRVVIRKTNKQIIMQVVESKSAQDNILNSVVSKELLKYGWPAEKKGSLKSIPAAYLSGFLLGKKLETKKTSVFVIDTGLIRSTKGSRVYAALKGLKDSGVKVNIGEEVIPEKDRIENENTSEFFEKVKTNLEKVGGKK